MQFNIFTSLLEKQIINFNILDNCIKLNMQYTSNMGIYIQYINTRKIFDIL